MYYFDEPDGVFFVANTEMIDGALVIDFNINMIEGMTREVYDSLCFQNRVVNLNERLKMEANDF